MLIKSLITNAAILVAFMFIGGEIYKDNRLTPSASIMIRVFAGITGGVMGSILMFFSVQMPPNIILDLRQFAIIVLAFHGGIISSVVTGTIMGIIRIVHFGVNTASIAAVLLIIPLSILCGIIGQSKIKEKAKWIYMNLLAIITVNIALFISLKNTDALGISILYFTTISIIVGFLLYYLSNYIVLANNLFQKYKTESKIADNLTDLITTNSPDGTYLYLSPSCKKILGYEPQELIGRNAYELFHPEDIEAISKSHLTITNTEKSYSVEYRIKRKDGNYIWFETTSQSIRNKDDEAKQLICVSRDITKRKIAEKKLVKSELRFRSLVNSMSDIVYTLDTNQRHTAVYGKWIKNEGLDKSFFLGKTSREILGEEASKVHEEANLRALNGEYVVYNWSAKGKDEMKYYQTSLSPIINSQNKVIGIVGVGRDVTEQKKIEQRLKEANKSLRSISHIDGLTNIPNRRYFDECIEKEWKRAVRNSTNLSLLLLDIDHFKAYNDTYGHLQGDECLKVIAKTLKESINRPSDSIARYGGEEFAVILPETSTQGAMYIADNIRRKIEALKIPNINSKVKSYVTVSIGLASTMSSSIEAYQELMNNADKALYNAKESGRNRVMIYRKG